MSPVLLAEATPEMALLKADIFAPVFALVRRAREQGRGERFGRTGQAGSSPRAAEGVEHAVFRRFRHLVLRIVRRRLTVGERREALQLRGVEADHLEVEAPVPQAPSSPQLRHPQQSARDPPAELIVR